MLKRTFSILTVSILFLSLLSLNIFACACCAEPGTYHNWEGKTDQYNIDVLSEMEFAETSDLYMSEAGWDMIKGLNPVVKNYPLESWTSSPLIFNSSHTFSKTSWQLNFTTKTKKMKGKLVLPMPTNMSQFKVDIHDGETSGGGGPLLYKEWRFKGKVKEGTGFFKDGITKTTDYFLVFQGRGNGCDNAFDFKNWHLSIKGDKANYQFFGEMNLTEDDEETQASK